jgi:outer membrane protein OmpA-like peptidoglycan-associated protein
VGCANPFCDYRNGSGKAELKAESKPQLEQMAALRVFIVGHTDNQGNADANVALSQ